MAHGINFAQVVNGTNLLVEKGLENEVHTLLVVGHVVHNHLFLAVWERQFQESLVKSNAFNTSLCQNRLVVHVVELVLNGRAATV